MTPDVELLTLPEPLLARGDIGGLYTGRECQHYARANLAPLQAENERLAEALRIARARAADLAAWLKSGNDVPADLPFVFRERWQEIANDIRALEAALAQEDRND